MNYCRGGAQKQELEKFGKSLNLKAQLVSPPVKVPKTLVMYIILSSDCFGFLRCIILLPKEVGVFPIAQRGSDHVSQDYGIHGKGKHPNYFHP